MSLDRVHKWNAVIEVGQKVILIYAGETAGAADEPSLVYHFINDIATELKLLPINIIARNININE
jgi:hypothetical protein